MYLDRLFISNVGPIETLSIELPFDGDGHPRPIVLLGSNGSGKTNVLSVIADALFEFEAAGYNDVLPNQSAGGRSYFRILGSITRRTGAPYSLSALLFRTKTVTYLYSDHTGALTSDQARALTPEPYWPAFDWGTNQADQKSAQIGPDASREEFASGAYCYFLASRSETPDWLNSSGIPDPAFDLTKRLRGRLNKPLFLESGIDANIQWIMGLILESRMNVTPVPLANVGSPMLVGYGDPQIHLNAISSVTAVTLILREVLGDDKAQFTWLGRHSASKVGVSSGGSIVANSLHALSSGQSTLLNIFLTLLRYADISRVGMATTTNDVTGICVIDEVDAHMHVDLQYRAIPRLISMFPNVQFILTAHSPLLVLGLSAQFGKEGLAMIGLPEGTLVDEEAYSEFKHAFEVLKGTKAFTNEVSAQASTVSTRLLVWVEGETDPRYLETAARLLGRDELLGRLDFEWIGGKELGKHTNFHSGKDALNHTFSFLKANPSFAKRPVLLLYDNDANKPALDDGLIHVRSIGNDPQNNRIHAGIEHLLPDSVFVADMFSTKISEKPNGTRVTTEEINKMLLCETVCNDRKIPDDFSAFAKVLDLIESVADLHLQADVR